MVSRVGALRASARGPFVYALSKERFLYIGETQKNPVFRWSEHLAEEGSFSVAVRKRDEEVLHHPSPVSFFAYRCDRIAAEARPVDIRRTTQFVEHALHVRAACEIARFGVPLELISDTTRTAPTSCRYTWVDQLAAQMFDLLVEDFMSLSVA